MLCNSIIPTITVTKHNIATCQTLEIVNVKFFTPRELEEIFCKGFQNVAFCSNNGTAGTVQGL